MKSNSLPSPYSKTPARHIYDFFGFFFVTFLLPEVWLEKFGLTSLQKERIHAVWPYLKGRVLDMGAGDNLLVRKYKNGVGVDVYDWGGGVTVIQDAGKLPFREGEFDTVCLIACLNHIPNRREALKEAYRVLKPDGRCLVTMINPLWGFLAHTLRRHDECHERGMEEGERNGFWNSQVVALLAEAGFRVADRQSFFYFCNNLFICEKISNPSRR